MSRNTHSFDQTPSIFSFLTGIKSKSRTPKSRITARATIIARAIKTAGATQTSSAKNGQQELHRQQVLKSNN